MTPEHTGSLDSPDVLHELIDFARLAPSNQNTQPWRFRVGPSRIDLFLDPERRLAVADDDGREQMLSVGCALEQLLIAAERRGLAGAVELFPRPGREELVATVRFRRRTATDGFRDPALFDAIERRHTNHGMYTGGPIPKGVLDRLRACVVDEGVGIYVADDADTLGAVTDLVARGTRSEHSDPAYRRERAAWVGSGALGTPEPVRTLTRVGLPHVDLGDQVADRNVARMRSSSGAAVVVTLADDRRSRVIAGQTLLRLWLLASHLGLSVQPMSEPLHVPKLRRALGRAIGAVHACPQALLRMGYAARESRETPRLPDSRIFAA